MSLSVNLPIRVDFRTTKREWHLWRAVVVGFRGDFEANSRWAIRPPNEPLFRELAIELRPAFNLSSYRALAENKWGVYSASGRSAAALHERYGGPLSKTIYGEREFDVLLSSSDPADAKERGSSRDAWSMREEFLNLPQKNVALEKFLKKWGHWDFSHFVRLNAEPRNLEDVSWFTHYVVPDLVWEQQSIYKRALSEDVRSWFAGVNRVPVPQPMQIPPYLSITDRLCVTALETTITLDKLRDVPFRICQRTNCARLFRLTSKRSRLYCSYDCAHAEAVRRGREAKQATKRKAK